MAVDPPVPVPLTLYLTDFNCPRWYWALVSYWANFQVQGKLGQLPVEFVYNYQMVIVQSNSHNMNEKRYV